MGARIKELVEDLLETYAGEWMSVHQLMLEYTIRFGPAKADSVKKAMRRLAASPDSPVESRLVTDDLEEGSRLEVCFPLEARRLILKTMDEELDDFDDVWRDSEAVG